jgi:hypothetical protein
VVRGLRTACSGLGGGDQHLIATGPAGYRLAAAVEVDVERAAADVRRAAALLAEGRHQAVLELAEPVTRLSGDQLLPGDEAGWLDPHRRAIDATALHAIQLVVASAGLLGEHRQAVDTARRAVAPVRPSPSPSTGWPPSDMAGTDHCRAATTTRASASDLSLLVSPLTWMIAEPDMA